jgi:hypothetical protein
MTTLLEIPLTGTLAMAVQPETNGQIIPADATAGIAVSHEPKVLHGQMLRWQHLCFGDQDRNGRGRPAKQNGSVVFLDDREVRNSMM